MFSGVLSTVALPSVHDTDLYQKYQNTLRVLRGPITAMVLEISDESSGVVVSSSFIVDREYNYVCRPVVPNTQRKIVDITGQRVQGDLHEYSQTTLKKQGVFNHCHAKQYHYSRKPVSLKQFGPLRCSRKCVFHGAKRWAVSLLDFLVHITQGQFHDAQACMKTRTLWSTAIPVSQ